MDDLPNGHVMKKNEEAWDEVTPLHQSYREGQENFYSKGGSQLDPVESSLLQGLHGKKVAHIACNCGQDTLSLVNLGAECTGFDQSGKAIEEARRLSEASGVNANFVKANALEIPEEYHDEFDIVYISKGVLVWIPDLRLLMKNVSNLLKKGGELFLYDQHPFVHLFDSDSHGPLNAVNDYFEEGPEEFRGLDYIGGKEYDSKPNYQFMVRLEDILDGIADSGMKLKSFQEFCHSMFEQFPGMVKGKDSLYRFPDDGLHPRIPLMMLVRAIK